MDIKNIDAFYHGILYTKKLNGGVKLYRFTEDEIKFYSVSDARRIRAEGGAGESVQLVTDAQEIAIEFDVIGMARKRANIGYYVDGILRPTIDIPVTDCGRYSAVIPLDGDKHTVEIYLPHLVEFIIQSIDVREKGGIGEPIAKKEKVYFSYGDSITQGMEANDPAAIYSVMLAREMDMELYDFGVGGATFQPKQIADNGVKPDLVTAAYGINDWMSTGEHKDWDDFESHVRGFCGNMTALYGDVPCHIISAFYHPDKDQKKLLGTYHDVQDAIERICRTYDKINFIRGDRIMPDTPAYYRDGVHPNDLGFAYLAFKLLPILTASVNI